ncbi:hypothetical protein [Salinisphaera sp. S4-8]|uniref:hypothetical protein n=1 Tax=Salinisphaera sp. S4-8 TaxID=633357 RepID=UPI003341B5C4
MGFFVSVTVSERDARRTFSIDAEFNLRLVFTLRRGKNSSDGGEIEDLKSEAFAFGIDVAG